MDHDAKRKSADIITRNKKKSGTSLRTPEKGGGGILFLSEWLCYMEEAQFRPLCSYHYRSTKERTSRSSLDGKATLCDQIRPKPSSSCSNKSPILLKRVSKIVGWQAGPPKIASARAL